MNDQRTEYEFDTTRFIADLRRKSGAEDASLRDLADRVGSSASTLSRIDNGHAPDMETFLALCGACDLGPGNYFKRVVWKRMD